MAKVIDDRILTELLRAPAQQRLFVYGTLMSSAGSDYGQLARARLLQEAPHRFAAQMRGQLYELGQYPGLVASCDADNLVHGQLLLLSSPSATLAWLDDYEAISTAPGADNEYVRELRDVTIAGGPCVSSWVYSYVKSVAGFVRLTDGRWQSHGRRQRVG